MRPSDRPAQIKSEILRLAPWFIDIEVADGLRTSLYVDAPPRPGTTKIEVLMIDRESGEGVSRDAFVPQENLPGDHHMILSDGRADFLDTLRGAYPEGLGGRSVLDCGCNAGGYLFWAKEMGAGKCVGFDMREHWIEQARFLAAQRDAPTEDMSFIVADLYDLPSLDLDRFDVVLFNGLFYHLPDPIAGLRIAADLAEDLLIVNTAARRGHSAGDAALVATEQSKERLSGGAYGFRWLPVGPNVLFRMLEWMGFAATRCTWWRWSGPTRDRIEVVASRRKGGLDGLSATAANVEERICSVVNTSVPPDSDVLVASAGNDALLAFEDRRGWHFPANPDGSYAPAALRDADAALSKLDRLRELGAHYLVVPVGLPSGLETAPAVMDRLAKRYPVVSREPGVCRIYSLDVREPRRFDPAAVV